MDPPTTVARRRSTVSQERTGTRMSGLGPQNLEPRPPQARSRPAGKAHAKAVLTVPWPLLRLTAHEIKGLGWQRPNGHASEPRRRRHELSRRSGLDPPLDLRGHGRVQEMPFGQWNLLQVVFQFQFQFLPAKHLRHFGSITAFHKVAKDFRVCLLKNSDHVSASWVRPIAANPRWPMPSAAHAVCR